MCLLSVSISISRGKGEPGMGNTRATGFNVLLLSIILFIFIIPTHAHAEGYSWEFVGAPMGDPDVNSIYVDPDSANIWYVTSWNGIYITRDSGNSWERHLSGYCSGFDIDPHHHARVYASSWNRLYRSMDRGNTWFPVYTFPEMVISILVSNIDSSIFVGLHWGGSSIPNGIYKSSNYGGTWNHYPFGVPDSCLILWDIEEDPVNNKLYVSTEICDHPEPYHPPFFRSSNGGLHWEEISGTLPWHVIKTQVHPISNDVYVLTEGLGLYRSTDFGDTWQFMNNHFSLELLIDTNSPNRFLGGNHTYYDGIGGVYLSIDTGNFFYFAGLSGQIVSSLCLDESSAKLHAACYGSGVYVGTPRPSRSWYIVPNGTGDAPTIQAGIDSAVVGDTVLLADGTFTGIGNRDIDFLGKSITVRSESGNPENCIVDCDSAGRGFSCAGADAETRLEGITVTRGLAAVGSGMSHLGGGLYCSNSSDGPVVTNCIFALNHAEGHGGGVHAGSSGTPTFIDCRFIENSSDNWGGGFICGWSSTDACSPTFINCTFLRNTAHNGGGGINGGTSDAGFAVFSNCIFTGNTAPTGGGMYSSFNQITLTNCTFSHNSAPVGGGIYCSNSSPGIENTIFAFSTLGGAISCSGMSNPTLDHCDIYGNTGGDWVGCIAGQFGTNGNFSSNPLFCDPDNNDFNLADLSPCLPENNPDGVLIGARGGGCDTPASADEQNVATSQLTLMQNYPNPFNPRTTITFVIPEAGTVKLSIYDVTGRLVTTLVREQKLAGQYTVTWDGRNDTGVEVSTGIYFARLESNGQALSKKILFLR